MKCLILSGLIFILSGAIMAMEKEEFDKSLKVYKKLLAKPDLTQALVKRTELLNELLSKNTYEEFSLFFKKLSDVDDKEMLPRKLIQLAQTADSEKEFDQRMNAYKEWKTFISQSKMVHETVFKAHLKEIQAGTPFEKKLPFEIKEAKFIKPEYDSKLLKYLDEVKKAESIGLKAIEVIRSSNIDSFVKYWGGNVDKGRSAASILIKNIKDNKAKIDLVKGFAHYDVEYEEAKFSTQRLLTLPFILLDENNWPLSEGYLSVVKVDGDYKITEIN